MIRIEHIRADDATATVTDEGFLEILGAVVARAGVLGYRTGSGRIVRELRDPAVMHTKSALNSYEGRPVLLGKHPTNDQGQVELATDENIGRLPVVGSMRNVRADVAVDSAGNKHTVTRADVLLWHPDAIAAARHGVRQFSLGYRTSTKRGRGVYNGQAFDARQTLDEGNHLVLTANARAGDVTEFRLDENDGVIFDEKGDIMEELELDGEIGEISENLKPILDAKLAELDAHEALIAERDALQARVAELEEKLAQVDEDDDADEMKGDSLERLVGEIVELVDSTRQIVGDGYQWQGKTARQIRCDALQAFNPSVDTKDMNDDAVVGAYVVAVNQHKASATTCQAIADATRGDARQDPQTGKTKALRWYNDRSYRK